MENCEKKQEKIAKFLRETDTQAHTLLSQNGYINLCFSPSSLRGKPEDKLGIVMTAREWSNLYKLVFQEAAIPWSRFYGDDTVNWLIQALSSVPDFDAG